MMSVLAEEIVNEERPGWARLCPQCKESIRYTILDPGFSGKIEPFLYCDSCSDLVLRDEDSEALIEHSGENATAEEVKRFYAELEKQLPPCPKGGRFTIRANAKCPHCNYEFPFDAGDAIRYLESKIIWIEGAIVYRGAQVPSNRLDQVNV